VAEDLATTRLYDEVVKKPGEQITYVVPWARYLRYRWRPEHRITAGTYIAPTRSTGFEFECTMSGLTGHREPAWPSTLGATVRDGSVEWTCRAPSNAALDPIESSDWAADAGISLSGQAVDATSQDASVRIAGGDDDRDYVVTNTVRTSSGDVYVLELIVKVRSVAS